MFIFPPKDGLLKIARHAYGYLNTTSVPDPSDPSSKIAISVPITSVSHPKSWIPSEGEEQLKQGLKEMLPELTGRSFHKTRLCWYTDT